MKPRLSLALGALIAAVLPLAGCAPQIAPTPTEVSAPVPSATPQPTLQGKITLWHAWTDPEVESLNEVINGFEADYPQVSIEVLYVPASDLQGKFVTAAATGGGPTLVIGAQDWGAPWFDAKLIADLTDLIPPGLPSSLNPTALEAVKYQGALIGLPETIKGVLLFRNKRIINTAPASFDQLVKAAKAATKGGVVGADLESGLFYSAANLTSACGGQLADNQGKPAFNSEAGVCFLQLLTKFKTAGPVENNSDNDVNAFKAGKAGIIIDGSWNTSALAQAVGATNLAIDPWPSYGSGRLSGYLQTENLYLNAQASGEERQAALALMQYFLSPEAQRLLADPTKAGHVPSVAGVDIADPLAQQEVAAFATSVIYPAQIWADYADPLNNAIKKVVAANADPRAALKEAEDAVNRKIAGG